MFGYVLPTLLCSMFGYVLPASLCFRQVYISQRMVINEECSLNEEVEGAPYRFHVINLSIYSFRERFFGQLHELVSPQPTLPGLCMENIAELSPETLSPSGDYSCL